MRLRTKAAAAAAGIAAAALAAVLVAFWVHESAHLKAQAQADQERGLRTAAAILDASAPEVTVAFGPAGEVLRVDWTAEPDLSSHVLIDRVAGAIGETATVFAFEAANGEFWRRSTNIRRPDGTRAVGTKLGADGPVHAAMLRGETFRGEATILGRDYYTIYEPIRGPGGGVEGILYVGTLKSGVAAQVLDSVREIGVAALVALAAAAALAWWGATASLAPVAALTGMVGEMTRGRLDRAAPGLERDDEIGELARGAEALRRALAEAEAGRGAHAEALAEGEARRTRMLAELRDGVGSVVDAAARGDFGRRVEARFDAPELAELAEAVNRLSGMVSGFLDDLERTLSAMAERDLARPMSGDYAGQLGRVAAAAGEALERLGGLVRDLTGRADAQRAAVETVADRLRDLSDRGERQAATIEETAATMTEISETVAATAEAMGRAEAMTESAMGRARQGAGSAEEAVAAVRRIERSSAQITEIIAVIESISFQTNLLALNAAVEAARAGDAGKGFAVVASEVRSLAQRSAEAARNITGLIKESAGAVATGVELVGATGAALEGIVEAIDGLSGTIRDVAAAGREQEQGVREISTAVSHLDSTVQEGAARTSEAAAAAASVTEEARGVAEALAAFRTAGERGGRRRAA